MAAHISRPLFNLSINSLGDLVKDKENISYIGTVELQVASLSDRVSLYNLLNDKLSAWRVNVIQKECTLRLRIRVLGADSLAKKMVEVFTAVLFSQLRDWQQGEAFSLPTDKDLKALSTTFPMTMPVAVRYEMLKVEVPALEADLKKKTAELEERQKLLDQEEKASRLEGHSSNQSIDSLRKDVLTIASVLKDRKEELEGMRSDQQKGLLFLDLDTSRELDKRKDPLPVALPQASPATTS